MVPVGDGQNERLSLWGNLSEVVRRLPFSSWLLGEEVRNYAVRAARERPFLSLDSSKKRENHASQLCAYRP